MKYLKTFENLQLKINDYVLLDGSYFKDGECRSAKLIDDDIDDNFEHWFEAMFILDDDTETLTVNDNIIIRNLTPEEIDQFELELNARKYNL